MTEVGVDGPWRQKMVDVLKDWEARGLAAAGWSVQHDAGDGAYRIRFRLRPSGAAPSRRYNFSELEFCQYVLGIADLHPVQAGRPALRLADGAREEEQA